MGTIFSIAVLLVIGAAVFYFVSGASLSDFTHTIAKYGKALFRKPAKRRSVKESGIQEVSLDGEPAQNTEKGNLIVSGAPVKSGIAIDVTVSDKQNTPIGSERIILGFEPVLIGRGEDDRGAGRKICLPDISQYPTTSRQHCTLAVEGGVPTLTDCYSEEESYHNGQRVHSMSFVNGKYVGSGLQLLHPVSVDIGDFILRLSPVLRKSVPTYGMASVPKRIPTYGTDNVVKTDPVRKDAPTKPFHIGKKG